MTMSKEMFSRRLDGFCALPLVFFSLMILGVLTALMIEVSPGEMIEAMVHPETRYALRFSMGVSFLSLTIGILIGIPAAYFMSRHHFPAKGLVEAFLDVPLVMPPLIAGLGLLFLLGQGLLGGPLSLVGIHFVLTPWGAVVAQTFIATPIILRSSQAAFESVDPGYEEAAETLGLKPWRILARINLPLAGRSIVSGIILAWARSMGEFGATLMVAGATRFRTETLPIAVYLNIAGGELEIAVSCAVVMLGVSFALLAGMRLVKRNS
jgi:molybdate transport system permease protein